MPTPGTQATLVVDKDVAICNGVNIPQFILDMMDYHYLNSEGARKTGTYREKKNKLMQDCKALGVRFDDTRAKGKQLYCLMKTSIMKNATEEQIKNFQIAHRAYIKYLTKSIF